jgi:hypothetical protein
MLSVRLASQIFGRLQKGRDEICERTRVNEERMFFFSQLLIWVRQGMPGIVLSH